jgi:glucokinase
VSNGNKLLTFDIGGSHIGASLCNLDTLQLEQTSSAPLSQNPTSEEFIHTLSALGKSLAGSPEINSTIAGASLAFPGPFDYDAGISRMEHKLVSLYGIDLKAALATEFSQHPSQIRFLNDAAAALLGEVGAGAAVGVNRVVVLTLGTGIGSGFAVNGQLATQTDNAPPGGEVWNLPFRGTTVEELISTRALQKDYKDRTGKEASVSAIAANAGTDPEARAVFTFFGTHLGQVIQEILAPFAPEIIVLGGGISQSSQLFLPAAEAEIQIPNLRIVPSTLLDKAALVGAAVYWRNATAS